MTARTPAQAAYERHQANMRRRFPDMRPVMSWDELDETAQADWADVTSDASAEAARLRARLEAADGIVRDVLESLCRRDGLTLESAVTPGEPARNYELADRLGVGHVFGLQPQSATDVEPEPGCPDPGTHVTARDFLTGRELSHQETAHGAAPAEPQPAPELAAGEIVYLYHWRFDRGEEFGLYRHAADADAKAAQHAGEGLSEVLSMAVLERPEQPAPEPSALWLKHLVTCNRLGHTLAALREIAEPRSDEFPRDTARNAIADDTAIREGVALTREPQPPPELAAVPRLRVDWARASEAVAERERERDEAQAERGRLAGLVRRYERITTAWSRGMYSARIDCQRGDVKAAIECLSEGLDGYDGAEWNGTETGAEWWERTKAEEGL